MRLALRKGRFAVVGVTALVTCLGTVTTAVATDTATDTDKSARPELALAYGKFAPVSELATSKAVTYDTKLVPVGSQAGVVQWGGADGATRVHLFVKGLMPNRTYGAHVHTKPCGKLPADAGPHYQDKIDPVLPSVDSKYANPQNEVWLDLKTDRRGAAHAKSVTDWRFRDGGARSVVLHEMATATHDGHAGMAGARLACVNVPFV